MKKYIIFAILFFMLFVRKSYAETIEKVNYYTVKITSEVINEEEGITITKEKNYTLSDLKVIKSQIEQALASWQNEKIKVEENILLQKEQLEKWDKLILEAESLLRVDVSVDANISVDIPIDVPIGNVP